MIHFFSRFVFAVFIFTSALFLQCNTTDPPPPDNRTLTLTFEDASCTEVWLNLTTSNLQPPTTITVKQNNEVRSTINLLQADTLLYIDSLLPNKSYLFKVELSGIPNPVSSNEIAATTMDTTSHNFSFASYQFGEHSSSILYDIAIIDDNNIWAVGEIYTNDSLGQPDPNRYNAVIWEGNNWEIKRIPYYYQGQPYYNPIQSLFAFSSKDIWFCGNGVIHWDGNDYIPIAIPANVWGAFQMNKIWGSSSNDLYVIGNSGNVAHYNGTSWQKIESGTDLNINDTWGDYIERTNEWEILAVGGNILQNRERIILKITNTNQVHQINTEGIVEYPLSGVWFKSKSKYYVSGDGIYTSINLDKAWKNLNVANYFGFSIRGAGLNDIAVCGGAGYVGHFNGYTWKNYLGDGLEQSTGNYYSTAIKGNTIIAAGNTAEGKAVAVIGKR